MTEPHIHYRADGSLSSLSGAEAVDLMRVATLISAIKMSGKTNGKVNITRGFTLSKALKMASEYTGLKYKREEWQKAADDLHVWLQTMKSAIPATQD